jgi:hypothetical protein
MNPGSEKLRSIVRMAMGMDGEQRLLQEVLRFLGAMADSCEAIPVVGPQIAGETLQKAVVRSPIAVESGYHKSSKLAFVRMSEFVHLLAASLFESYAVVWRFLQIAKAATNWMPQIAHFSRSFLIDNRQKLRKRLQSPYRRELLAWAMPKRGLEPNECFWLQYFYRATLSCSLIENCIR